MIFTMTISCFREEKKSEVKPPAGRSNGDFTVVNLSGQYQKIGVSRRKRRMILEHA